MNHWDEHLDFEFSRPDREQGQKFLNPDDVLALMKIPEARWQDVPAEVKIALSKAAERGDTTACNAATFKLYRLSKEERAALGGNGDG